MGKYQGICEATCIFPAVLNLLNYFVGKHSNFIVELTFTLKQTYSLLFCKMQSSHEFLQSNRIFQRNFQLAEATSGYVPRLAQRNTILFHTTGGVLVEKFLEALIQSSPHIL